MLIEVSKYSEAKSFSGICCNVVSDHTLQVSIFATYFAHSTTPIDEVCFEPLPPSCGHGVKSTFLLGQPNGLRFCYTQSRSVETRSSSNIVLSCLHFFPILLNLMQKIDYFVPILGRFWPYLALLKPVFRTCLCSHVAITPENTNLHNVTPHDMT